MKRRVLLTMGAAALGALWLRPAAAAKVWRIGILDGRTRGEGQRLVNAMRELGYVEGRDIEYLHVEYMDRVIDDSLESQITQRAAAVHELVRSLPDAIVCYGTGTTRVLQRATTTIPIVTNVGDPIRAGFAKSLVRPGGNITGVALAGADIYGKLFDYLKAIIPGNWSLAIVYGNEYTQSHAVALEEGARACGIPIRVMSFEGKDARQADRVLAAMRGQGVRVLSWWAPIAGIANAGDDLLLATKYGLATAPSSEDDVAKGALMSYHAEGAGTEERKAFQLVRILRGTPPGEIPFETPTTYRLWINRKTAKILGLTVPREVLLLADKVFE